MNDSEKQDVLTARTQASKAYEVSKIRSNAFILSSIFVVLRITGVFL